MSGIETLLLVSTPDISTHLHLTGHPAYVASVAHLQGISVCDITGLRFATVEQN